MKFKHLAYHNELIAEQMKKLGDMDGGLFASCTSVFTKDAPLTKEDAKYSTRFIGTDERGIVKNTEKVRDKVASKITLDTSGAEPNKYYDKLGEKNRACGEDFKKSALKLNPEYVDSGLSDDVYACFSVSNKELGAASSVLVSMTALQKVLKGEAENIFGVDETELEKAQDAYPAYLAKLSKPENIFTELSNPGAQASICHAVRSKRNAVVDSHTQYNIAAYTKYGVKNGEVKPLKDGVAMGLSFQHAVGSADALPPEIRKVLRVRDVTIARAFPEPVFIAAGV